MWNTRSAYTFKTFWVCMVFQQDNRRRKKKDEEDEEDEMGNNTNYLWSKNPLCEKKNQTRNHQTAIS